MADTSHLLLILAASILVAALCVSGPGVEAIAPARTSDRVSTFKLSSHSSPDSLDVPRHKVTLRLDEASQARQKRLLAAADDEPPRKEPFTPVVFWHGMGDTAYGSINIERIALQRKFPGMKVFSIEIGNNTFEDEFSGYFLNVNYQIDMACQAILNNPVIKGHGSFNAIGFSQGSQFLRGLIQRCPLRENGIRAKNFISLGGQHQGVYGLPNCNQKLICDHIRYLLTHAAYQRNVQEHSVQAEYWHNPYAEEEYKSKSAFLADINNENEIKQTYNDNLMALENMVLVEFLNDDMVIPRQSSLFGFYAPNQTEKIVPIEESSLYREDRLGLRKMHTNGRLRMISIPGRHLQYKMAWFMDQIASVYLNN